MDENKSPVLLFEDALPSLVALQRRHLLTPFIGAGMSRPACTSWGEFVKQLRRAVGLDSPDQIPPEMLYQLADEATELLAHLPLPQQTEVVRCSLEDNGAAAEVPAQSLALARCYWPLVVSTNYDAIYLRATRQVGMRVLGRSRLHCHEVLRALDAHAAPILWAVQGFVGPLRSDDKVALQADHELADLAAQIVVGHQQYQSVINGEPHFRRAFAELAQRRSILFVGSGVQETYLLNLLGEIRHHYGTGVRNHYALVTREEITEQRARFMTTRLGIVPVVYGDDHRALPQALHLLADCVQARWREKPQSRATKPLAAVTSGVELRWTNDSRPDFGRTPIVRIRYDVLAPPNDDQACLISAGRRDGRLLFGSLAHSVFAARSTQMDPALWRQVSTYTWQYREERLFAVVARSGDVPSDQRELQVISSAVADALATASPQASTLVIGPVASGPDSGWHPLYPFVQLLRGIRRFLLDSNIEGLESIEVAIVAPRVWGLVESGKLSVAEILSGSHWSALVVIRGAREREWINVLVGEGQTVGDLRALLRKPQPLWEATMSPPPRNANGESEAAVDDDYPMIPGVHLCFALRAAVTPPNAG